MRIATWNVNSVRQRLDSLLAWLKERKPDVVCLQEIKCIDDAFPRGPIEDLGYNVAVHGQKTFNGVALLSRFRFDETRPGLPGGDGDAHARFIHGTVSVAGRPVHVACLYLPNGNPPDSDKYTYKINWMERLSNFTRQQLRTEEPLILAGDFNVIPEPIDANDPAAWRGDALFLPQTRAKFRSLLALGLTDAIRAVTAAPRQFTFWDYQAGAWQRDNGIRIDHLLLSPQVADRLVTAGIDRHVRGWEKPSDHVPVWADFDFG
jgi:exodeoxyribonuclease-3